MNPFYPNVSVSPPIIPTTGRPSFLAYNNNPESIALCGKRETLAEAALRPIRAARGAVLVAPLVGGAVIAKTRTVILPVVPAGPRITALVRFRRLVLLALVIPIVPGIGIVVLG